MLAEIIIAAKFRVIAVCMGDDSLVYGFPGIDVEIALRAIKAFVSKFYEWHEL